jgi:large subunit ribosomal protein L19
MSKSTNLLMTEIMRSEVIAFNNTQRKEILDFHAGDVVKVHRKIKEGDKERIQIFEGMVIAMKGKQSSSPMMTVRKVSNGIGVEIVVPVFSPNIEMIELVKRAKVRKSKLYYVREKAAKALRFTFTDAKDVLPKELVQKDTVVAKKTDGEDSEKKAVEESIDKKDDKSEEK